MLHKFHTTAMGIYKLGVFGTFYRRQSDTPKDKARGYPEKHKQTVQFSNLITDLQHKGTLLFYHFATYCTFGSKSVHFCNHAFYHTRQAKKYLHKSIKLAEASRVKTDTNR
jgi:hypothetical protein